MSLAAQEPNYDTAAAERRAERIRLRLDSIADNITTVLPMIREAIEKNDHAALGYRSVGEYVSDRFGGALSRLPVDLRRPVVHELASAGMSTRAIAPVVGADFSTVSRDLNARVADATPAPAVDRETGEILSDPTPESPAVTGIDGKTYTRKPEGGAVPPTATAGRLTRPQPPKYGGSRKKHAAVIASMNTTLAGLAAVADEIGAFDSSINTEEAARLADDLSDSIRSLNRLKQNLYRKATP